MDRPRRLLLFRPFRRIGAILPFLRTWGRWRPGGTALYVVAAAGAATGAYFLSPLSDGLVAPRLTSDDTIVLLAPPYNSGLSVFAPSPGPDSHVDVLPGGSFLAARGAIAAELRRCAREGPWIEEVQALPSPEQTVLERLSSSILPSGKVMPFELESARQLTWTLFYYSPGGAVPGVDGSCELAFGSTITRSTGEMLFQSPRMIAAWLPETSHAEERTEEAGSRACLYVTIPEAPFGGYRDAVEGSAPLNDPASDSLSVQTCGPPDVVSGETLEFVAIEPILARYSIPAETRRAERETFIAGALIGVAGGFAVAAVESGLSQRRARPKSTAAT